MENISEILKEYDIILNKMIGIVKSFEVSNYSMTVEQEKDFCENYETLSKSLDDVVEKLKKTFNLPQPSY